MLIYLLKVALVFMDDQIQHAYVYFQRLYNIIDHADWGEMPGTVRPRLW